MSIAINWVRLNEFCVRKMMSKMILTKRRRSKSSGTNSKNTW